MFVSPLSAPVRITDIIPSQDYATYENEAISLACYIAGDPTPTVSWEKVGGNIYNKYKTKEALLFSALIFLPTIYPSARKDYVVMTLTNLRGCSQPIFTKAWAYISCRPLEI